MANIPYTVVPLGIGMSIGVDDIVSTILGVHESSGIKRFVLHAPGHGVRISGYYDAEGYRKIGKRVKSVQDAVRDAGIEVGFLMGPTINVGINHPWQKYVSANGEPRLFTACPGDPAFRKAFAERCGALAVECLPFLYMMEDDYRYFGAGCFCKDHLARFSKATGREWTREALSAELSMAGNSELRSAWNDLQTHDLVLLAAEAEKAIHGASPSTRIGISAPGGFKDDCTALMARTLAGDGRRPFIRWWGTVYGYDVPIELSRMLFSALWAKENVSEGIDCVYEADACPNSAFYGSGARLGASCSSVIAAGFDGLWYWAASCESFKSGDPRPNLERYHRDSSRWLALQDAVKGGCTVGVSVAFNPNLRLVGSCGAAGDAHPYDSGSAATLLNRMGLTSTTRHAAVTAYAGYWAFEGMDDAEVERILAGNVFLDGDAAEALTERGLSRLIGVEAVPRERIDFTGEYVPSTGVRIASSFHQNYGLDSARVVRLSACGAETVSHYFGENTDDVVQPSVTRFTNELGGRVVVESVSLASCSATNVYNFRKRDLLIGAFEWLGGEDVFPIRTEKDVNVILIANEDPGKTRLVVHAVNISCDMREHLSFKVASSYIGASAEVLAGSSWRPVDIHWNGAMFEMPASLGIFDTLVLRLVPVGESSGMR